MQRHPAIGGGARPTQMEATIDSMSVGAISSVASGNLNSFHKKHPDVADQDIRDVQPLIQYLAQDTSNQTEVRSETDTSLEEDPEKNRKTRKESGLAPRCQCRHHIKRWLPNS